MSDERRCFQCGRVLNNQHKLVFVEMGTNGKFYRDGVPSDVQSQGGFHFGSTCIKKVLKTGEVDWKARFIAMGKLDWDGT